VSQGALFRHFPSKGALLAAAVEDLFPRILGEFGGEAAAIDLPPGLERAAAVVDLVWAAYDSPGLQAAVELYVASRTDADLGAALAVVEPPHRARIHDLAASLLPDLAPHPSFRGAVDVVVDAIQGAAMGRLLVLPDEGSASRAAMRDVLASMLAALEAEQA
jgi:AcrR family transcriptional regulator